jgi:hypothetical protein
MTNDEKRARIEKIVVEFTREYIERHLLWQLGQIVAGADNVPAVQNALSELYKNGVEGLRYTMEPQEWLTMALYGAGLVDEDHGEMREVCQAMAEWLFAVPGIYSYQIPDQWADTEMGALWWQALLRTQGDELITIAIAAKVAGRSVQAISSRIDRGTLRSFTDPLAPDRQGKRLVRMSDIMAISNVITQTTVQIHPRVADDKEA